MHQKRSVFVFVLLLLGVLTTACEKLEIGDINADPGLYRDKDVSVAGLVTESIGVLGKGIYQIDDGTGKLWVWSESRGVPSKGAMVGVRGRVTSTFTFLGINYATVMRESSRRSGS